MSYRSTENRNFSSQHGARVTERTRVHRGRVAALLVTLTLMPAISGQPLESHPASQSQAPAASKPSDVTIARWLTAATQQAISKSDYAALSLGVTLGADRLNAAKVDVSSRLDEVKRLHESFRATQPSASLLEQTYQLRQFLQKQPETPVVRSALETLGKQLSLDALPLTDDMLGADLRDDRGFRSQLESQAFLTLIQLGDELSKQPDVASAVASFTAGMQALEGLQRLSARDAIRSFVPDFKGEVPSSMDLARLLVERVNTAIDSEVTSKFSAAQTAAETATRRWNDAMTALAIGAYWISQNDPATARTLMQIGSFAQQAWTLGKALSSISASEYAAYGGAVMAAGYVAIAFIAINELQKSQQPSTEELMFSELLQIRKMLVHLEQLLNKRFDRVEELMAGYHQEEMRVLQLILNLSLDSNAQLEAIRSGLADLKADMRTLQDDIRETALGTHRNDYVERSTSCAGGKLPESLFRECVGFFFSVATGWSTTAPFSVKSAVMPAPELLASEPLSYLPALLAAPSAKGLTPVRIPPHPSVWLNGALPLLALLERHPNNQHGLNRPRVQALLAAGREVQRFRELIGDTKYASTELSRTLPEEFRLGAERLALALKGEALTTLSTRPTPIKGVDLLEPQATEWGAARGDDVFEAIMPGEMDKCAWSGTDPATLPVPRGIAASVDPLVKLAAKLDPAGNKPEVCFELWTSEPRVYFAEPSSARVKPMYRYIHRYRMLVFYRTAGMRKNDWYNVQKDIGHFTTWLTPTDQPHPDHASFKAMGTLQRGQSVEGVAHPDRFSIGAIRSFTASDAYKTFGKDVDRGGRWDDGRYYLMPKDNLSFDTGTELYALVAQRMSDLTVDFARRVSDEAAKTSRVRVALEGLMSIRAQAAAWLQILRPVASVREPQVTRALISEGPGRVPADELFRLTGAVFDTWECRIPGAFAIPAKAEDKAKADYVSACNVARFAKDPWSYALKTYGPLHEALSAALPRKLRTGGEYVTGMPGQVETGIVVDRLSDLLLPGVVKP